MRTYDKYGLESGDIEKIRRVVEDTLKVTLTPRDSSFIGEYYSGKIADGEVEVWGNIDPVDGERHNKDLPETAILIYISSAERADEIQQALMVKIPNLQLLKRSRI